MDPRNYSQEGTLHLETLNSNYHGGRNSSRSYLNKLSSGAPGFKSSLRRYNHDPSNTNHRERSSSVSKSRVSRGSFSREPNKEGLYNYHGYYSKYPIAATLKRSSGKAYSQGGQRYFSKPNKRLESEEKSEKSSRQCNSSSTKRTQPMILKARAGSTENPSGVSAKTSGLSMPFAKLQPKMSRRMFDFSSNCKVSPSRKEASGDWEVEDKTKLRRRLESDQYNVSNAYHPRRTESVPSKLSRRKSERHARSSGSSGQNKERDSIQALVRSSSWDGKGRPDLYLISDKVLGEGSFGVVKLAHQKITGHKVAIKVYDRTKFKKASQLKRCRQEIEVMSALNCVNITKLFEAFESGHYIYLVMEALSGGNLCTYVKSHKHLSPGESLFILFEVAKAINYLHHSCSVVHRDIKLENIMFTGRGSVKLVDFGFSVFVKDEQEKLNSFCGTPSYMAPEILRKQGYMPFPVDLWSLGVVFFAMLFGKFPFRAKKHDELYKLILNSDLEFNQEKVGPCISKVLPLLLCREVQNRMTASELLQREDLKAESEGYRQRLDAKSSTAYESEQVQLISDHPENDIDTGLFKTLTKFGFNESRLRRDIVRKERSHVTATYYLLRMKQARKSKK